jgi:hypothetical protein
VTPGLRIPVIGLEIRRAVYCGEQDASRPITRMRYKQCPGGGGEEEAGTNNRDVAVLKGGQGPTMLRMFLSFSVVSEVLR